MQKLQLRKYRMICTKQDILHRTCDIIWWWWDKCKVGRPWIFFELQVAFPTDRSKMLIQYLLYLYVCIMILFVFHVYIFKLFNPLPLYFLVYLCAFVGRCLLCMLYHLLDLLFTVLIYNGCLLKTGSNFIRHFWSRNPKIFLPKDILILWFAKPLDL